MKYVAPIRYSGYRISLLPPEVQRDAWVNRLSDIQPLLPYLQEALSEHYFADDSLLDIPFDQLVRGFMESGELFACVVETDAGGQELVGLALLRDVRPGRDAWIEAWTVPKYRGKYPCGKQFQQILDYCFAPWNPELYPSQKVAPKGLGLRKLKAQFSAANRAAEVALWRNGFFMTGRSPGDGLFKGTLTDIITVEKINPSLLPKEPPNVWKGREAPSSTTDDTGASLSVSTGVERPVLEPKGRRSRPVRAASVEREESGAGSAWEGGIPRPVELRDGLVEPEGRPDLNEEHGSGAEPLHGVRKRKQPNPKRRRSK
jgi:RimJ/RimL family protein N-acetyltransferase